MSVKNYLNNRKSKKTFDEKSFDEKILELLSEIKKIKGDSPTSKELLDLIKPLIPRVKDGHTPTKTELLALIRPLIPEVEDGHTPTDKELLNLIKPLIPQVKDGHTPTREELVALIIPLIPKAKEGSPDKPKEIAKKLNTLEEQVEQKVIKGLEEKLKKLETNIFYKKSGGGGMGDPQHEQFTGDGATTTFTTTYPIAANGTAVFGFRYQGQTLHLGTHYTVSGKNITTTFTPASGKKLDITYIR